MPVASDLTITFDRDTVFNNRGSSADQSESQDWKLAPDHSEGYFAPRIIHPRPDSETTEYERHRVNYPGQPYRIPIAVYGGRAPFKFSLFNAPAGMTIGKVLVSDGTRLVRPANYRVINASALDAGVYNPVARVEDQDGVVLEVTWQIVVDADDWSVLDTEAVTNGSGTWLSPYNTITAIDDGKPVLVRGGIINWEDKIVPIDEMSQTWVVANTYSCVMNQANSSIGNNPGMKGLWFSGFTFNLPSEYNGVNQYFRFEGLSRFVFFDNVVDFDNEPYTFSDSTENVSFMMWTNQGLPETSTENGWYNVVCDNTFRNIQDRDLLLGYSMRYTLVENNSVENYGIGEHDYGHGFYFKMNCSDVTIRGNYSIGNNCTGKLVRVDAYSDEFLMDRYDISYNSYRYYGEDESGFGYCHEFLEAGDNRYFYRNTSYSQTMAGAYLRGMGESDIVHFSRNVFISGGTNVNGIRTEQFQGTLENTNYLAGTPAANIVNSSNYLIGGYASELGTRGWEIK